MFLPHHIISQLICYITGRNRKFLQPCKIMFGKRLFGSPQVHIAHIFKTIQTFSLTNEILAHIRRVIRGIAVDYRCIGHCKIRKTKISHKLIEVKGSHIGIDTVQKNDAECKGQGNNHYFFLIAAKIAFCHHNCANAFTATVFLFSSCLLDIV